MSKNTISIYERVCEGCEKIRVILYRGCCSENCYNYAISPYKYIKCIGCGEYKEKKYFHYCSKECCDKFFPENK